MGNVFDRKMSDVSVAMLESSLKDTQEKTEESLSKTTESVNTINTSIEQINSSISDINDTISGLIDVFYPVGSYYDTSDSTFNPNTSWGGTWVLEGGGKVLVSSGTGYTIGGSGGAETVSYTPLGTIGETALTTAQLPAHDHGSGGGGTTSSDGSHTHSLYAQSEYASAGTKKGVHSNYDNTFSGANIMIASGDHTHTIYAHTHNSVGSGQGHDHEWTGIASTLSVMQPYITVNRWHRTA